MFKLQGKVGFLKFYGCLQKFIYKMIDFLKKNQVVVVKGKGKENEVFGGVMSFVDGKCLVVVVRC